MNDERPLDITMISTTGAAHVVSLGGEVDMLARPAFEHAIEPQRSVDAVVVDLSDVTFIDSSGFRVIHAASTRHRVLVVVPPASRVARAVAVSGLAEVVELHGTLDEAIAEVGASRRPAAPSGTSDA